MEPLLQLALPWSWRVLSMVSSSTAWPEHTGGAEENKMNKKLLLPTLSSAREALVSMLSHRAVLSWIMGCSGLEGT